MVSRHVTPQRPGQHSSLPFRAKFSDIAGTAGLRESSVCGHSDHADYVIEAMGCGVAFLDFDNDGWLDILVLSGSRFAIHRRMLPTGSTGITATARSPM